MSNLMHSPGIIREKEIHIFFSYQADSFREAEENIPKMLDEFKHTVGDLVVMVSFTFDLDTQELDVYEVYERNLQ